MSNAIDMQLIADFGGTMLWPMIALCMAIATVVPFVLTVIVGRKKGVA